MTFSENVDSGPKSRSLTCGDAPDSGGTLTLELPKMNAKGLDHKATNVMQPCFTTACIIIITILWWAVVAQSVGN